MRLAVLTALVIAEGIWTLLHRMMAARISVPAHVALAALPQAVQLLKTTPAEAAVWAGQAPAIGTWVVEINAGVAILLDAVRNVRTGKLGM